MLEAPENKVGKHEDLLYQEAAFEARDKFLERAMQIFCQ